MAKYTPKSVKAGFNLTTINDNFNNIATELNDKVLYRNNPTGEANQWETQQDANSQRLINLKDAVSPSEPATLRQLNALSTGVQSVGITRASVTATAGQTVFATSSYTLGSNNLSVYINGVRQDGSAYTETSTTSFTLSEGAQVGDNVEYIINEYPELAGTQTASSITYNGSNVQAALDAGARYMTLAEAVADTSLVLGNRVILTDRANGVFDVITTGTTVGVDLPNGFNIIASTIKPTVSLMLQTSDIVNAKEFGAEGDGITDDYGAIQEALNYASSNLRRTVYLPAGSYLISQKLINTDVNATPGLSSCGLVGDGPFTTRIKPNGDFTAINLLSSYIDCGGFSIEWSITEIGSIPSTRIGVEFGSGTNQTSQCRFHDILVMYAYRSFYLKDWTGFPGFGTMYIVDLERLISFRSANYGFFIDSTIGGSTTLRFSTCWSNCSDSTGTFGGDGFYISGVNDITMVNCAVDFCNSRAIWVNNGIALNILSIALESCYSNIANIPLIQVDATSATINGVKEISCHVDVGAGNKAYGVYAMPNTRLSVAGYSRESLDTISGTLYKIGLNSSTSWVDVSDNSVSFSESLDNGWFSMISFGGTRYSSTGNAPTQGINSQGEYVRNKLQTVGSPKGWYCTVSGNPGTWVSEGNL